ncbi:MAG: 4Fe-4S dicluster domain-containing protein [Coriobacteriales bacterium]|nr:4Fe-4S dicluster domain-containing protein [Coriobacteriales bacterium]
MGTLGFYFDQTICTGCRACQVACKDKNNLEIGVLFRNVRTFEVGVFPQTKAYHYSGTCNHCANPACVPVCPVGAMFVAEDGTVQHDDELCIGCLSCIQACPYSVPQYIESLGIVQKCDSCKQLRDNGWNPACVDACPMRALEFGDLDELRAKHGDDVVSELPILPSAGMTEPSLLISCKACAELPDFREKQV